MGFVGSTWRRTRELKVHRLQNLRVIDASVMPSMPSANACSAIRVIAGKGSDLIRGKAAPAPVALDRRSGDWHQSTMPTSAMI